ncbi:MAG TPA: hypothetical protein VGN57_23330 [Pirellulaceae bacterium]|jgi:hypothetical protein|nr:hypothetical protein [Pirellulaceae bacterium]
MHGISNLALALLLLQPGPSAPPVAPPNAEPLTEERLLAIEQQVETIQREYWDNGILLEEQLGSVLQRADRQVGRTVEVFARVVRVDDQRVHVRFFQDLGETQGPLVEFLDRPGGAYLGGTRLSPALVVGPPTLPLEFARSLRRGDMLRIRGPLISIELSPRDEQRLRDGTRPERAVRVVLGPPRIERVQEAQQFPVPAPALPALPAPSPARTPLPLPLPIPPLPLPVPR